ncbi:MAG: hypothetical protein M3O61_18705 [Gemmatimonadota bacterium]|nr:hypothetical protein [Gemmatimonadota bacterium]
MTVTLKRLVSLSQNLNEASDALSQQIAQVESALNELKLGIWAWVELYREAVDVGGYRVDQVESVGYGKHKGRWCLLFSTDIPDLGDPVHTSVVPLREAPRADRIAAVDKLPKLVEALEAKAVETTELAMAKAKEVARFAQELKETA